MSDTTEIKIDADDVHWFEDAFRAWGHDDFPGVLDGLTVAVNHFAARAIAALAGQADAGRWIPCSERLPEVGQPVAVMDAVRRENCGGDLIRQVQDCAYLDDYGSGPFWNRRGSRGECLDAYTHWTALPPESLIAGATP